MIAYSAFTIVAAVVFWLVVGIVLLRKLLWAVEVELFPTLWPHRWDD